MKFILLSLLFAILCYGAYANNNNNNVLECMHEKYKADLGDRYKNCYDSSRHMRVQKIKDCYQEVMKDNQVVVTKNRQMTVDRTKFGTWADANSNKNIGRAMKSCYTENPSGSDMYKEAARASQCVFLKVKQTCQ